ncbi:jg14594 [Pararge aegeria aegeria]|uniref:Jg14594 protein n=1 Tax=Pararge aegeria aegeria TaxID=348720 RepID=A0A8S4R0A5_9NEOP|nr:jg14594 [Pararge aegeria aegeria]
MRGRGVTAVGRRMPRATHASRHVTLPAPAMTEGAGRPRPAPPRKPDSLTLSWPRWDDPPPPAPEPTKPPLPIGDSADFGGFSPYTPPAPIQPDRRPRRPQSVVSPRQIPPVPRRPHSIGSVDDEWCVPLLQPVPRRPVPNLQNIATLPRASFNLPSSRSDYQLQRPAIMTNGYGAVPPATSRRLSLPGGVQSVPKLSATFHGLSGLMGPVPTLGTPGTPSTPAAVREAVRHLLAQPRNGFPIMDHKLSLFIDILDAQERFSQVKYLV